MTHLTIVKWLGTIGIIGSTLLRAFDYHIADMTVGFIGTACWAYAAIKEKDYPLLTVNGFVLAVLGYGLIR
jgi:phosphopantothenate synthetase